jgi:RimJ/RimL family protein N-acetyltransferase
MFRPYENKGVIMMDDIKNYQVEERLKNGNPVIIRAIRPDDNVRIKEAFKNLDPQSVYTRLFTFKKELTDSDLKRITEVDFEKEVALVVARGTGNHEVIIGSGRYFVLEGGEDGPHAEVAFMVEEDYQGQGIAKMIIRHLTAIARSRGLTAFEAEVLRENKAMLTAFARCGLPMTQQYTGETMHVTLSLTGPTI